MANSRVEPTILTFSFFASSEAAARVGGRRRAMNGGWSKLRVVSVGQPTTPPLPHYWQVVVEATERRGTGYHEYHDFKHINALKRGVAVRTLGEGTSHAGGSRHVMAPGPIGTVVKREGPNVRVSFPDPVGHTFLYHPASLEVVKP